jgi:site-specific DNA-methyltransferase (adenine-specific)
MPPGGGEYHFKGVRVMEKINIEYLKLSELKPYKNNPRKNDKAVDAVAASIKEFGFKVPVVIDGNNEIIAGHTRLKAAKKLGLTEVPCIRADDLTPAQVKAYRLADNKTAELAEWDLGALDIELAGLDLDMTAFGFGLPEKEEKTEAEEDGFNADEAAGRIKEPKTKRGDLYALGNHRLLCGDSTDENDVARLMKGELADTVFTDPPYFSFGSSSGARSSNGDMTMVKPFFDILFKTIAQFLKPKRGAFVCCDWRTYPLFYEVANKYMNVRNLVVWDTEMLKMGVYFRSMYELITYATNDNADEKAVGAFTGKQGGIIQIKKNIANIWHIKDDLFSSKNKLHSSAKPVELISKALDAFEEKQEKVLDLFAGSGSTLIACEQLNRKCYAMEIDPRYCDVIIERWEKLTGGKAELING